VALAQYLPLVFAALALAPACSAPQQPPKNREARPPTTTSEKPVAENERDADPSPIQNDCEFQESSPINGDSPFPGLTVYGQAGEKAWRWYLAGDHALLFPYADADTPSHPAVLVSLRGGGARALVVRKIMRFDRYEVALGPDTAGFRQPGIMLITRYDDPCLTQGLYAFDPSNFRLMLLHSEDKHWPGRRSFRPGVGWLYGDRFLVRIIPGKTSEAKMLLFDMTSGEPIWQRDTRDGAVRFMNGRMFLSVDHDGLYELAAADGSETRLWPEPPWPSLVVSASSSHVAFVVPNDVKRPGGNYCPYSDHTGVDKCDYTLRVMYPTGATLPLMEFPGEQHATDLLSDGNDIFVAFLRTIQGLAHTVIAAFDATSGRERWRSRPVPCGASIDAWLESDGASLYAGTCDGVLRKLDRKTGAVTGEFGLGSYGTFARSNGLVVFVSHDAPLDGLAVLDEKELSSPKRETVVHGLVAAAPDFKKPFPLLVRVGSKLVLTDNKGRFRVHLRGRGVLTAEVALGPNDLEHWNSVDKAFGFDRGEHELVLEIRKLE
jgi:outer membrane protein assembly factor BamB